MARSTRAMPRPVEAFPCGSRSISRTRSSLAASAVAKLTAVVVLPTPPFWLAMARIRAPDGAGGSLSAESVWDNDTAKMADPEDPGIGSGTARGSLHLHVPLGPRFRQFGFRGG